MCVLKRDLLANRFSTATVAREFVDWAVGTILLVRKVGFFMLDLNSPNESFISAAKSL